MQQFGIRVLIMVDAHGTGRDPSGAPGGHLLFWVFRFEYPGALAACAVATEWAQINSFELCPAGFSVSVVIWAECAFWLADFYFYEYIRLDQMRRNAQRIAEMMAAPSPRFEYREPEEWIPGRWFDAPPVRWRQKRMPHRENLMRLPEDANVLLHGRELAKDQFLIDRDGNVYRYLPDLQAAIVLELAQAQDAQGMPYSFRPANSCPCRVLSVEEAIERLQTMA